MSLYLNVMSVWFFAFFFFFLNKLFSHLVDKKENNIIYKRIINVY